MKREVVIMEILEAFDLLGSYRAAVNLIGCSPNTVRRYVLARESGVPVAQRAVWQRLIDGFEDKVWELVDRCGGKIRAGRVHRVLVGLGYVGSERTTCNVVRQVKMQWQAASARVHRPWVASAGQWMQYDYGAGPVVDGVSTVLFVAWLPWSKARFVMLLVDKTMSSLVDALDQSFRFFGGVPRYVLTDNERTVTSDYVCRLPVRNAQAVSVARWYSTTIHTCMPYDPASKGGVERSVRVAKDDLVPKDINLRGEYASFADLVCACSEFNERVNGMENSYGFIPFERLEQERKHLHKVPAQPYPLCEGVERKVDKKMPVVVFDRARYSVPFKLMGKTVSVRYNRVNDMVLITHRDSEGLIHQVAMHKKAGPGETVLLDAHFPPAQPSGPLSRRPRATNDTEASFLSIGAGAVSFIRTAADKGVPKLGEKLAKIVALTPVYGIDRVDKALRLCAEASRFNIEDLLSVMERGVTGACYTLSDDDSYAQGTSGWAAMEGALAC